MVMEMFGILPVSVSISWLCQCILVSQEFAIGGNWVKSTQRISLYYLLQLHVKLQLSRNKKVNFFKSLGFYGYCCFG